MTCSGLGLGLGLGAQGVKVRVRVRVKARGRVGLGAGRADDLLARVAEEAEAHPRRQRDRELGPARLERRLDGVGGR